MGEISALVLKWVVRSTSLISLVIAFIVITGFVLSAITVSLNANIIGDLMAIVQLWLPFNLSIMIVWLLTVSSLYIAYRAALFVNDLITNFTGK